MLSEQIKSEEKNKECDFFFLSVPQSLEVPNDSIKH